MDAVFLYSAKKRYTNILLPSHNLNLGRVGVFWRMLGAASFAKLPLIEAPLFWGLPVFGELKCAKNDS